MPTNPVNRPRPSLKMHGPLLLGMAALFAAQNAWGQQTPMTVGNVPVELRLGFVGDGIVRYQFLPINAQGQVAESEDGPLLVPQKWLAEPIKLRTLPAQVVQQKSGGNTVSFDPATWTIRLSARAEGMPPQEAAQPDKFQTLKLDPATGRISFPMTAPVFGLGEGGQPGDRRGWVDSMQVGGWNDTKFPLGDWGEHMAIPWVVSPAGWGAYFHKPAGTFDLTGKQNTEGTFIPAAGGGGGGRGGRAGAAGGAGPIDGFLTISPQPAGLMKSWADITGYPSLPPIWSLGYIQSHREVASAASIIEEARTFRAKNMPCDMMVFLGTGFITAGGWNTGHGEFDFNPAIFPNPQQQLKEFHDLHFKVALHVTPRGPNPPGALRGSVKDPIAPGAAYEAGSAAHYWARHVPSMNLGVDAWWPDEGEGPNPLPRLARIQLYWEGSQLVHPDQRPFALHRTGAVGMQRYGGWLWSGDIKSTWAVLQRHVPLGLNVSVGGTPYWGTDTGGFNQDASRELTGELWARWFQFSTFTPLFRAHGQQWQTRHLPWGFSVINGAERDPKIEEICKKFLDLRYQLMPYTYSVVYEGHEDGMPIMRALWLHYPADAKAVAASDEYLWGRDLLVAPVVEKGQTDKKLYLPPGKWYDYWTGQALDGGKEITRKVDLSTMPLYARAGAIIPLGPVENYTQEKPNDPLTVNVYPGADGAFTMIEDDGITFSSKPMRLKFTWTDATKTLALSLEPGSQMRAPLVRNITIKLNGVPPKIIEFRGTPASVSF